RQLPSSLIPFSSTQGKFFFKKAIETGHAEIYFQLANYFTTQSEPAFCGLGTLSMVLNSLEVDPLKVWKGPWRWYADEMLDCCRSLSDIRLQGITLSEFECLAKCNGLSSRLSYSNKTTLNQFENDVKLSCQSDNQVMVLSYSRKTLGQTGDGHFSPVGGYDPEEKMVLVLDVARFKYPAYWVPLDLLFESLKPIDPSSGISRGYTLLS
ncbi:PCS-1 protein, partial [Neoconidiobolus thromboides FSU 785]